jgi:hypothetical protein
MVYREWSGKEALASLSLTVYTKLNTSLVVTPHRAAANPAYYPGCLPFFTGNMYRLETPCADDLLELSTNEPDRVQLPSSS